jgi:phosphoribosylformimino-5-aminoimidazole carboxamide ribonucleotide (ProFAR) isomerase
MMDGPDVDTIGQVCNKHREARVFASAGATSVADINALRNAGAYAVIIGKAFLESILRISDAVRAGAG